jgi:hypothetical protein
MKYLFLDDERIPTDVTWIKIPTADWNIVRSYLEAIEWVVKNGFPDVISFDHDLGYEAVTATESGFFVVTDATEEKSGYDFAKWLCEYDMDTNVMPDGFDFYVHSMNEIGARNIRMYMDNYIHRIKE